MTIPSSALEDSAELTQNQYILWQMNLSSKLPVSILNREAREFRPLCWKAHETP